MDANVGGADQVAVRHQVVLFRLVTTHGQMGP